MYPNASYRVSVNALIKDGSDNIVPATLRSSEDIFEQLVYRVATNS